VLRGALKRIAILVTIVVGGTALASLVLGALAGASALRALAVGFYAVGAAVLVGSFVIGVRGPLRPEWGEDQDGQIVNPNRGILPRSVRRATADERTESRRNSLGLFVFGMTLVLIGAGFDPTRHVF
jgi:hypothetical protein